MDILAGLREKLRFIESFYETASQPFREVKRKIEAGESPYTPPSFNFDGFADDTPPFLAEWQDADESLNLIGQAALTLVQESLYHYLQSFLELKGSKLSAKAPNRLERYRKHFRESLSIDWDQGPVPFERLEEINLARNDIAHQGDPFAMTRYQSTDHYRRFPFGLFVHEIDRLMARESGGHPWPGRICVTRESLAESIRRVETFCEFLDANRT